MTKPVLVISEKDLKSRKRALDLLAQLPSNKKLIEEVRADRTYKMPPGYISSDTITQIATFCLQSCKIEDVSAEYIIDGASLVYSYRMALWWAQKAPVYCLTPELGEAFNQTNALHKPEVFAGWKPSLPSFLLALPKGFLSCPAGNELDFLVVFCGDKDHPEWNWATWKGHKVEGLDLLQNLYFQWATCDKGGSSWFSGTAIEPDGSLTYTANNQLGKTKVNSKEDAFIEKVRNLVINCLLCLEYTPNKLTDVSPQEIAIANKGFGVGTGVGNSFGIGKQKPGKKNKQEIEPVTIYPRWMGKDYQYKTTKTVNGNKPSPSTSTIAIARSSPCAHWRKGHWRFLEPDENNRWKESKAIWIEPNWIGVGE